MMKLASKHGVSPFNLPESKIKDLFVYRQLKTNRRIKIYCGYVFIFASTSTRCYTVYKLPNESDIN